MRAAVTRLAQAVLLASAARLCAPAAGAAEAARTNDQLYLGHRREPPPGQSALDAEPQDGGLQGARLGAKDNEAGARFLPAGQRIGFRMTEVLVDPGEDFAAAASRALAGPAAFVVLDAPADELLAVADLPAAKGKVILNAGASDTRLRDTDCRANVLHTLPSDAMLADALLQFLLKKRWTKLFLVAGEAPQDGLYAQALRDSARKFGAKIVADKVWSGDTEQRRTVQADTALFTQGPDYDVLLVADTAGEFGNAMIDNTALPRPVAGTQGLSPKAWDRSFEQWGATQLQNRFVALAGRPMLPRDWAAWAAVRAVGESAFRERTDDPLRIEAYLRSDRLRLDGFKGRSLDFRPWSGELRQPIHLAHPGGVVSVSPQDGFLHPVTELDTLGIDRPESRCFMAKR